MGVTQPIPNWVENPGDKNRSSLENTKYQPLFIGMDSRHYGLRRRVLNTVKLNTQKFKYPYSEAILALYPPS